MMLQTFAAGIARIISLDKVGLCRKLEPVLSSSGRVMGVWENV
jgi:hypothetical protein